MDLTDAAWRKSSWSGSNGGGCVEVADNLAGAVAVRDSKVPHGAVLLFPDPDFRAFIRAAKDGGLDR